MVAEPVGRRAEDPAGRDTQGRHGPCSCTLGALAAVWLGHLTWLQAVRDRAIMLAGDAVAVRSLIDCFGASRFSTVPRADPGVSSVGSLG